MTLRLGSCPKCGGALARETDIWGERWVCLACGYAEEIERPRRREDPGIYRRSNRGRKPKGAP